VLKSEEKGKRVALFYYYYCLNQEEYYIKIISTAYINNTLLSMTMGQQYIHDSIRLITSSFD